MKRKLAFVFAVLIAASAATGCDKIKDIVNTAQEEAAVSSSSSENASEPDENETEASENAVTNKKKYKKVYITDPNKKDSVKEESEKNQSDDENGSDGEDDEQGNNSNNSGGGAYSADAIYQSAIDMYNSTFRSCPYELDYDDTDANGFAAISDASISGTDDIVSRYCTVFAEPDSYIYEKYVEKDGKVYYNDATRGSNIYYQGTDLEYVSGDESSMTFNAVSHYCDPETGEALEDKTAVFSVKLTDDGYKVTEFKYPQ